MINRFFPLVCLLITIFLTACGGGGPASLTVTFSPTSLTESDFHAGYDSFKFTASISLSNPSSANYQWYKNGTAISGATTSELAASLMGDEGHTVRGYEFKCEVTAYDQNNKEYAGEGSVTVGGPTLAIDRGVLFHNLFRTFALNEGANTSIAAMEAATGANLISIGILYSQADADSTTIYEEESTNPDEPSTIAESDLISQIQYAHDLGLKVMIYPEIWIDGYSGTGPRDQITGTSDWFTAYQSTITHLAEIAENNSAEFFCVGVELTGTEDNEASWRALIQAVRGVYSGSIIYSSTYPAGIIDAIAWWDAVDYIGVTANFETRSADPSPGSDPTLSQLTDIYSGHRDIIEQLGNNFDKSVFVTEGGVYSADGGTIQHIQYSDTLDHQEQADFYEALFETFADRSWVAVQVVHDWFPTHEEWYQEDPSWSLNTSFIGKPAERVIRSWFGPLE